MLHRIVPSEKVAEKLIEVFAKEADTLRNKVWLSKDELKDLRRIREAARLIKARRLHVIEGGKR
jgi:hypothetical protein